MFLVEKCTYIVHIQCRTSIRMVQCTVEKLLYCSHQIANRVHNMHVQMYIHTYVKFHIFLSLRTCMWQWDAVLL